jgi:hypothetical protein
VGKVLVMEVDGRRQPDLLPSSNERFKLKGASGITIQFTIDDKGRASQATIVQPEGVFTAKRKG